MSQHIRPLELEEIPPEPAPAPIPAWRRSIAYGLKALIPLSLLIGAGLAHQYIQSTAPIATRTAPERVARLVEVAPAVAAETGPKIAAWGEVTPAQAVMISPETTGRVVALNEALTQGGRVTAGEQLFTLDTRDLVLAEAEATARIRQIEARIAVEAGQAARAARDLDRVPLSLSDEQRALVLREPQMAELRAELAAAEAARDRARVMLSHAAVRAPFDAVVMDESVALGSMVSAGEDAAELVATDRFFVQLAVPVTALDWIDASGGKTVALHLPGSSKPREGQIERLAGGLTQSGRMAELIVSIDDPLAILPENVGKPQVLLGSFIKADLFGREIDEAVAISRAHLRDANSVWVMNAEGQLEIRKVEIAWRGADEVLITSGLEAGERVVTTHLATVAAGMPLRLAGEER